jgi:phosphatidylglycerophosphate synthase
VPRLTPLYSARTTTSSCDGSVSDSVRISPRPGAAIQNARAWTSADVLSGAIRPFWCFWRARYNPARVTPNQVTAIRAVLVALLAGLVVVPPQSAVAWSAVIGGTIAAVLDGVDGWLARRTGMMTAFGARFDMEIDALLILVLAILAWRWDKAGPWVLMSGLLRYLFVAAGWVLSWMRRPLAPTRRGQVICIVQVVALIVAVAPITPPRVGAMVAAVGLLTLAYSFLVDTVRLWRNANSA